MLLYVIWYPSIKVMSSLAVPYSTWLHVISWHQALHWHPKWSWREQNITIDIPFLLNDETDAVTFHAVIAWAGSFGLFYRAVACGVLNESLHSTIRMALLLKFLYAVPTLWWVYDDIPNDAIFHVPISNLDVHHVSISCTWRWLKNSSVFGYVSHMNIVGDGMFAIAYGQFLCEYYGSFVKGFGLNPLPESGGLMEWFAWLQNSGFVVPLDLLAFVSLSISCMMMVDIPSTKVKSK